MDPIDLLKLCHRATFTGVPGDLVVPSVFSASDFEQCWRKDPVQVRQLIDEILLSPNVAVGLELLMRSGVFHALFPELVEIRNLGDDPVSAMHKDVWAHTKQVVEGVPDQLELRWGALMHDVGKARTRKVVRNRVTFHNHDFVGAKMLDQIEHRLDLFRDDATLFTTVRSLVLNHLRPAGYKASWSDSGVRRLLTDLGGLRNFERLMQLSRADLTTKNPNKRERCLARGRELEARVASVYAQDTAPKLPKGTMGIILERSGRKPGKWLNTVRWALENHMASPHKTLPADADVEFYVLKGLEIAETVND